MRNIKKYIYILKPKAENQLDPLTNSICSQCLIKQLIDSLDPTGLEISRSYLRFSKAHQESVSFLRAGYSYKFNTRVVSSLQFRKILLLTLLQFPVTLLLGRSQASQLAVVYFLS